MAITNIFGRDFYQGLDADMAACVPRVDGALFWTTDTLKLYCYSGAAWNEVGTGAGGSVATDVIWDAKGDLAAGTGANTASKLTVGADGEMLFADSGEATGLRWDAAPAGGVATDAIWDAKGDLAVGTGANTASKLTVGVDDTYLIADSGEATGAKWAVLLGHDHSGDAGDGGTFDAANLTSGVSGDGTVLTSDGIGGAAWESIPALLNHDHSGDAGDGGTFDAANLTAGASTDGQVLTSDGIGGAAWEDAAAGGDVATDAIWDAKGDLAVGTGANTALKLTIGADGTVLTADSGEATGAKWADVAPVRQTILTFVGTLVISDNPLRIYNQMGVTQTISEVFIAVNTAPTGANVIVDVHKDGVTIFTNQAHRPEIVAAGFTDSTTDIDVAAWADGEYLTAHVDQIGSVIAGADLVIHIIHR